MECHSNLQGLKLDSTIENVASFDLHPQFRISVKDQAGNEIRVSLDDKQLARDDAAIKLNHAVHLKPGLLGKDGPVTLECSACHQPQVDRKSFKPIDFNSHCRDCHSLGFDERLPDIEVPHGDAESVYPALFTEYTKLFLLNSETTPATDRKERIMPDANRSLDKVSPRVDTRLVVQSAREAEERLFTKTACAECHTVSERPASEQRQEGSHYTVKKPRIRQLWFRAANFSHAAHDPFSCESCHSGVDKSSDTSDVLLPSIALCRDCHAELPKEGLIESDCVMCHSYHDSKGIAVSDKREILDYLRSIER